MPGSSRFGIAQPPTTNDLDSSTPTIIAVNISSDISHHLFGRKAKMFSPEYEKRLLKHCSPTARRLFAAPESSSPSDRFIPCRYEKLHKACSEPADLLISLFRHIPEATTTGKLTTRHSRSQTRTHRSRTRSSANAASPPATVLPIRVC